jgi:hypothetical protein
VGYETDGVARLSDSFANGAMALSAELEATMAVVSWGGYKFRRDHLFGSDVDQFGELAPIPVAAAHLTHPWVRVILLVGNTSISWRHEDARLAATIAGRLRTADGPLLFMGDNPEMVADLLGNEEGLEILTAYRADRLLETLEPDDLIVAPSYVLRDIPIGDQMRLARRLSDVDVAVVAGPNRLTIARPDSPLRIGDILNPQD